MRPRRPGLGAAERGAGTGGARGRRGQGASGQGEAASGGRDSGWEGRPAPTREPPSFLVAEAAPPLTFPLHGETGNRQAPAHLSDGDSGLPPRPKSRLFLPARAGPASGPARPRPPVWRPARMRGGRGTYHLLQGGPERSAEEQGRNPERKAGSCGSGFSGRR